MAQNEKKILSTIPLGGTNYAAGMEKEFAEVATPEQLKYLTEQGAIEGFTTAKATEPADANTTTNTTTKKGK